MEITLFASRREGESDRASMSITPDSNCVDMFVQHNTESYRFDITIEEWRRLNQFVEMAATNQMQAEATELWTEIPKPPMKGGE